MERIEIDLDNQGFHVVKVMDPTAKELKKAFEDFINEYGLDENNRLLLFFSGHGYTRKNRSKGYLGLAEIEFLFRGKKNIRFPYF